MPESNSLSPIHQETGAGWNIVAKSKYRNELPERVDALKKDNPEQLWPAEQRNQLRSLCQRCRCAIHLQCANGYDTLFLWRFGAGDVVGITLYLMEGHPLSFLWDIEGDDYRLAPGPSYCEGGVVEDRGTPPLT